MSTIIESDIRRGSDRYVRYTAVVLASVLLSALAAVAVFTAEPAEAASGGKVKRCGGGKIYLKAAEKRLFVLHNRTRRDHNLRTFCVHPRLQKAARAHSEDMMRRDYLSHNTKGSGEDPGQRLRRFGYNWTSYAENIGYASTPNAMFRQWMNSSLHRRNILKGSLHEIGIGSDRGHFKPARGTTTVYTVDFGTRR